VTYNMFGDVYRVADYELGIETLWILDFYSGITTVNMSIFLPQAPPPEPLTRVSEIELWSTKARGKRTVNALVRVQNKREVAAADANVVVSWTLPDGSVLSASDLTSSSGYAYFEIARAARGRYTLQIADVVLSGHRFDSATSVLESVIDVRKGSSGLNRPRGARFPQPAVRSPRPASGLRDRRPSRPRPSAAG
jgi:hypothetical protein